MGRNISLFADYHGKENSVTNFCGLMLKMVWQENAQAFSALLDRLFEGEVDLPAIGPQFSQQNKGKSSMPDLEICQNSFQILVETKLFDWFHEDQLERHAQAFRSNVDVKILVMLSNLSDKSQNEERNRMREKLRKEYDIYVTELTFEELYAALHHVCTSDAISQYVAEFHEYLNRNKLLPTWKYILDVVNCAGSRQEVEEGSVYMCPDEGRAYSHKPAKYFGAYWEKAVQRVFTIDGIVVVNQGMTEANVTWKSGIVSETELIIQAKEAITKYRQNEILLNGIQVFVLSNRREVEFIKDTPGGMYAAKKYFTIDDCKDIDDLVNRIDKQVWSCFK